MANHRAPSPRYRSDDPTPNVQLQPDDVEILWHVYSNRILDADSIASLFPTRSPQVISRRLNKLRKGDDPFLQRLILPTNRVQIGQGSQPMVYALANRGAQVLNENKGMSIPTTRWQSKNDALKTNTIQHELSTSRFMARAWRDAAASGGEVTLQYQHEVLAEYAPNREPSPGLPNTLRTPIDNWYGYRGEQGTAPDRIFSYTANGRKNFIFLEIDEGTETIVPGKHRLRTQSFWNDTSLLRKFVIYASAFQTRAHEREFGIEVFRVLTITTSEVRMSTMREACNEHLGHIRPGLFLFSSWDDISVREWNCFKTKLSDAFGKQTSLAS